MTKSEGSRVHRHPDAVDCLEGLPEDEAAVHPPLVRRHADGLTRYWTGDGQVRSRDVAGDGTPDALLEAVPSEFGPLLPRLAADLGSGAPDLDGGGRALRDASPGGGAAALKLLPGGWTRRCRRRSAGPAAGRWPGTGRGGRPGSRGSAGPGRSARISAAGPAARDACRLTGRWGWRTGR